MPRIERKPTIVYPERKKASIRERERDGLQIELVKQGLETERLEIIPLDRVLTDNALVDDLHVDELAFSMSQKRGQITPIAVRARLSEESGKILYDVIDGFHRAEGKRKNGDSDINATVIYGCNDEEMYDLRILAASSVKSVQFARIAEWITKSYETTIFAKKGLPITFAFSVVVNDSKSSYGADLSPQEVNELREWISAKCARWGTTVRATYKILSLVEIADPKLIKEVRQGVGGGRDRQGRVTPARLEVVARAFPGDPNHEIQRIIMNIVVDQRLTAEEAKWLAVETKRLTTPGQKEMAIRSIAMQLVKETRESFDSRRQDKTITIFDSESKSGDLISTLNLRILELEGQVSELKRRLEDSSDTWWRKAKYLLPLEKELLEKVVYEGDDIEKIMDKKEMSFAKILSTLRSAFAKRRNADKLKN